MFAKKGCATIVRYEDLLIDHVGALVKTLNLAHVNHTAASAVKIDTSDKKHAKFETNANATCNSATCGYENYYLKQEWGKAYDQRPGLLQWINGGALDFGVVEELGYNKYEGKAAVPGENFKFLKGHSFVKKDRNGNYDCSGSARRK
jgi:hypothetical protein